MSALTGLTRKETKRLCEQDEMDDEASSQRYNPSIDKVNILGSDVAELIAAIGHNLQDGEENPYFQRNVSNVLVHPDAVETFREWSNGRSQAVLEEYHEFLSEHEVDPDAENGVEPRYVAGGIYFSDYRPRSEEP